MDFGCSTVDVMVEIRSRMCHDINPKLVRFSGKTSKYKLLDSRENSLLQILTLLLSPR